MINITNKACAAYPLLSYRYSGPYGFIMIGATDDADALNEAKRSLENLNGLSLQNLQKWNGKEYINV